MTLAVRSESGLAVAPDAWEQTRRVLEKRPLGAAPAGLQQPIWRLWACHRHLAGLDTPMPIAAMFGVWVREHGLREDDAAAILSGFLSPARMGQFRFASDLVTALASAAAEAIRRRQAQAEAKRRLNSPTKVITAAELERVRYEVTRQYQDIQPDIADPHAPEYGEPVG